MTPDAYRMERIERLLNELKYEVTVGMMNGEIEEFIRFRWYVPISKTIERGCVECFFQTHPIHRTLVGPLPPRLEIVGGKETS